MRRFFLALCLLTAVLLCAARAEGTRDSCTMSAVYTEQTQTLSVRYSLLYTNRSEEPLDSVMFGVYSNCYRRESTLPADNAHLEASFPAGYAPAGTEIRSVRFNAQDAAYAFSGRAEEFMRVQCALAPGETGRFDIDYILLLSPNRTLLGTGEDVRLSLFYPSVCVYDGEFITNAPSNAARFLYAAPADFRLTLYLPDGLEPALYGLKSDGVFNGYNVYSGRFQSVSELALALGRRYYSVSGETALGSAVTVKGSSRARIKSTLDASVRALDVLEELFGALPTGGIHLVYSDTVLSDSFSGLVLLGDDADDALLVSLLAKQYFGCAVVTDPATDPFLTAGVNEYLSLLYTKHRGGEEAFTHALRKTIEPALKITVPGSLTPDSYLSRFATVSDYDAVAAKRGAAVLHEIALTMGDDRFTEALKLYYERGAGRVNTIEDFVAALDEAAGRADGEPSVGNALVAWLYTIDEYSLVDEIYD